MLERKKGRERGNGNLIRLQNTILLLCRGVTERAGWENSDRRSGKANQSENQAKGKKLLETKGRIAQEKKDLPC